MDKILVAGIDTVLGANLAALLASRYTVVGLSWSAPIGIAGCETAVCEGQSTAAARDWVAAERPQWIVHCGEAAQSSWHAPAPAPRPEAVRTAGAWAKAAAEFAAEFTLVSSDALFTGPWMFHRETDAGLNDGAAARMIRMLEKEVAEANPAALIVRTNAFGWSPCAGRPGWVENILTAVQNQEPLALDCMRHATPILATDFAELLEQAYQRRLHGTWHLAGAERVNPFRFACLLADEFGCSAASLEAVETATAGRSVSAGETSLQTHRLRKALESPFPLIREGLGRLYEQFVSGYRDRFSTLALPVPEKVA